MVNSENKLTRNQRSVVGVYGRIMKHPTVKANFIKLIKVRVNWWWIRLKSSMPSRDLEISFIQVMFTSQKGINQCLGLTENRLISYPNMKENLIKLKKVIYIYFFFAQYL